jgi:hypothetical protein
VTRNTRRRRRRRRQRQADPRREPVIAEKTVVTWLHLFNGFGVRVYPWQPGRLCGLVFGGIIVEARSPEELAINMQCVLIEITKSPKLS